MPSSGPLDGVSPVPSGVSKARSWIVSSGNHPVVRGSRGVVIRGRAYAPSRAPYQVKLVIWSANQIRHKPYKWGGGHGRWKDSGYDCSGSVSYALHGAGLLDYSLDSRPHEDPAPTAAGATAFDQKKAALEAKLKAADGPRPQRYDVHMKLTGVAGTDVQVAQFITKLNHSKLIHPSLSQKRTAVARLVERAEPLPRWLVAKMQSCFNS